MSRSTIMMYHTFFLGVVCMHMYDKMRALFYKLRIDKSFLLISFCYKLKIIALSPDNDIFVSTTSIIVFLSISYLCVCVFPVIIIFNFIFHISYFIFNFFFFYKKGELGILRLFNNCKTEHMNEQFMTAKAIPHIFWPFKLVIHQIYK